MLTSLQYLRYYRLVAATQSYTGEGDRAVLGTSNITEGLRRDDTLIPDPARDLCLKLAREPLALSMDWYVVPLISACLMLSSMPATPISPNT